MLKQSLIKQPQTLGSIADVFVGMRIPGWERKGTDYLIIKPQHIFDYKVHLGNNRKEYCNKDFVKSFADYQKYFLKDGDVLVRMTGKPDFGIYSGEDNKVIANGNTLVIRPNAENKKMLHEFFTSEAGINLFEKNLFKMYARKFCGVPISQENFLNNMDISETDTEEKSFVSKITEMITKFFE